MSVLDGIDHRINFDVTGEQFNRFLFTIFRSNGKSNSDIHVHVVKIRCDKMIL